MNKSTFWDSYLSVDTNNVMLKVSLRLCEHAFEDHKESISKLLTTINPSSVAILGSGYLRFTFDRSFFL